MTNKQTLEAYLANGGTVNRVAPEVSGKAPKGTKVAPKRTRKVAAPAVTFDMSDPDWKWAALSHPKVAKAIKAGVFNALVGSGWATTTDVVEGRISEIRTILAAKYLDDFNPEKGKGIVGWVRKVAFDKTVSYVKLHRHLYDGAVNRGSVNPTDYSGGEGDDTTALQGIHADKSAELGFVRVEMRERLAKASERLSAAERKHLFVLVNGGTAKDWAKISGCSPVTAHRQKEALLAKLHRLLADE
jgi:DNA-directed RNA polymerase specialized sigma24 family protein